MFELEDAHEFVDYYALLEVPTTAPEPLLRKRIFSLYEEAGQNLNHRNHRKRYYYAMLYETHLARARHFLLDAARRQHYNDCLSAYHAGRPFDFAALFEIASAGPASKAAAAPVVAAAPAAAAPAAAAPAAATAVSTTPVASAPSAATPKVSKPTVAAPLPSAAPASAPPLLAAKGPQAAAKAAAATAAATTATPRAAGAARPIADTAANANSHGARANSGAETGAGAIAGAAAVAATGDSKAQRLEKLLQAPTLHIDAAEDERRRDYRRREMIGAELRARSRVTGLSAAFGLVLCGAAALYPLQNALLANHGESETGLSGSDLVLIVMAYLLVLGLASVVSWQAARFSRRRIIGGLSRMTYDELLRHCRH